jgi:acyl-homoserine lactone synthase
LPLDDFREAAVIYVIDRYNRAAFECQLEDMYRVRHKIYVGRRRWKALERPDCRDVDQFDTADTVYFLGLDETGTVTSGLRLNPTTKPHLINTLFPHAVTFAPIPVGDDIYEITRYFLVPERLPRDGRRRAAGELITAMLEHGLSMGLTHISLLCDAFFMSAMLEMRWKVRSLGLPTSYAEGTCIAVLFEVSDEAIANTRETRGVHGPVYVYQAQPPLVRLNGSRSAAVA